MQGALAHRLISGLLNLAYPGRCPACERPSDSFSTAPLCAACWSALGPYEGPACPVCAEPATSPHAATCGRCLKSPPPFTRVQSFGLYAGALREAVHQLKFHGAKRLARPLGRLMADMDLPLTNVIVPVPLGPRSLRERGFNQTLLAARSLSRETGIPVESRVLAKPKDTPPQVGLPRAERLRNLRGAFRARGKLDGLSVLLLDDVVTTTATVRECTRVLLRAGAREVLVASIARGGRTATSDMETRTLAYVRRGSFLPVKPSFADPHVRRGGVHGTP